MLSQRSRCVTASTSSHFEFLDNYTYEGSFRIGSSAHGFMVNGWTGPWVREMTTIYLTADECIPVAETYYGVTHDGKRKLKYCLLETKLKNCSITYLKLDIYLRHCFELYGLKTCLRGSANNTGADRPANPRSLISAFVIRF